MKISTKGRYGLRAFIDLACYGAEEPVSISSISARQEISERYLEQLMAKLKKAGLVKSIRGAGGGYRLAKDAAEVSVGDVLRALEGDLEPATCAALHSEDSCEIQALSGKVKVEWVDSVLHPSILQKYNTDGNVIVVSCDATGKSTTISFSDIIQSDYYSYYTTGNASESSFDGEGQLTSAINYVTSEETSKIYRTSGHGESTFSSSVSDLLTKNNLETEEINLSMSPEIPDDCDLLFLYAPTSDITDDEKTIIEKYLSGGGKVYLILGDTTSDTPNLDGIMSDYGLKKVSGYIADTQRCYQGNYYAIFPQLSLSGDLGSGISNQMVLLLNSPGMEKTDTDNDNLTVTPFMQTSDSGYAVTENDQIQGQYILGAVSTNAISADSSDSDSEDEDDESDATDTDTKTARLTVLASASMISSDITDQLTTLDNLTLFVNSVTENFDNVNNVAIEAKSLSTETNTPMHAGAFSILVIFIIPLAILILGFVIWMRRRKA